MENKYTVTAANVQRQSYYNLVRLQKLTGYADPISAIKKTGEQIEVITDACGNIVSLSR